MSGDSDERRSAAKAGPNGNLNLEREVLSRSESASRNARRDESGLCGAPQIRTDTTPASANQLQLHHLR